MTKQRYQIREYPNTAPTQTCPDLATVYDYLADKPQGYYILDTRYTPPAVAYVNLNIDQFTDMSQDTEGDGLFIATWLCDHHNGTI